MGGTRGDCTVQGVFAQIVDYAGDLADLEVRFSMVCFKKRCWSEVGLD